MENRGGGDISLLASVLTVVDNDPNRATEGIRKKKKEVMNKQ